MVDHPRDDYGIIEEGILDECLAYVARENPGMVEYLIDDAVQKWFDGGQLSFEEAKVMKKKLYWNLLGTEPRPR